MLSDDKEPGDNPRLLLRAEFHHEGAGCTHLEVGCVCVGGGGGGGGGGEGGREGVSGGKGEGYIFRSGTSEPLVKLKVDQ